MVADLEPASVIGHALRVIARDIAMTRACGSLRRAKQFVQRAALPWKEAVNCKFSNLTKISAPAIGRQRVAIARGGGVASTAPAIVLACRFECRQD